MSYRRVNMSFRHLELSAFVFIAIFSSFLSQTEASSSEEFLLDLKQPIDEQAFLEHYLATMTPSSDHEPSVDIKRSSSDKSRQQMRRKNEALSSYDSVHATPLRTLSNRANPRSANQGYSENPEGLRSNPTINHQADVNEVEDQSDSSSQSEPEVDTVRKHYHENSKCSNDCRCNCRYCDYCNDCRDCDYDCIDRCDDDCCVYGDKYGQKLRAHGSRRHHSRGDRKDRRYRDRHNYDRHNYDRHNYDRHNYERHQKRDDSVYIREHHSSDDHVKDNHVKDEYERSSSNRGSRDGNCRCRGEMSDHLLSKHLNKTQDNLITDKRVEIKIHSNSTNGLRDDADEILNVLDGIAKKQHRRVKRPNNDIDSVDVSEADKVFENAAKSRDGLTNRKSLRSY